MAGDIIGIHNHGQLQIGDTLHRRRSAGLQGHSLLRAGALPRRAPARPVQGEAAAEGPAAAGRGRRDPGVRDPRRQSLLLGAVGQLQFEVVAARLASEYKVDAIYDDAGIATARWLTYPDEKTRRDFERDRAASLATDVDGNPVYLAPNRFNLQVTMERWPQVGFHATREHGQKMAHK